jgi:phosphatidylserine/phosphatidylglycerophosphate/cardiolipin synthase-like enzyme
MSVFYMFVASPPASTPAGSVYRERLPFGPHVVAGQDTFSTGTLLQIAESAPAQFRSLRAFCKGLVRVSGLQSGFPSDNPASPLAITLEPLYAQMADLSGICRRANLETPVTLIYTSVSRNTFESNITPRLQAAVNPEGLPLAERLTRFMNGEFAVDVPGGFVFGEASELTLDGGYRNVGFAAQTGPGNFLDPVVLYRHVSAATLSFDTPAMSQAEVVNSWVDVATRNRVLITFRDEWNAPLVAGAESVSATGAGGTTSTPLGNPGGTIALPPDWGSYQLRIEGRKLTPMPSDQRGASDLSVSATPPAHLVVGTVRPTDWFHAADPPLAESVKELWLYTEGNRVDQLVDGFEFFPSLVEDLEQVNQPDHFVFFTGWSTHHEFPLVPGRSDTSLQSLLSRAGTRGARIRALLWDVLFGLNRDVHSFINDDVPNGASIIDARTHHTADASDVLIPAYLLHLIPGPGEWFFLLSESFAEAQHVGSHHIKCFVLRNARGAVAHVGGLDINPNRLDGATHAGENAYHDVSCRVVGPAVTEIVKVFVDRWNDHPEKPSALQVSATSNVPVGTCMVQVARTYAAGTQSYAPGGDRTIWATLREAIRRARTYIYIEDQYLWYRELRDECASALSLNPALRLIVVLDGQTSFWVPDFYARGDRARYLFLTPLRSDYPDRVHVFTLKNYSGRFKVHSKLVIVDDVFATVGSACMNQRSMTHDAELNLFVLDGRIESGARKFARDLRVRLWAEHLGIYEPEFEAMLRNRLGNIDGAIDRLVRNPPFTTRLDPYDYSVGQGTSPFPTFENIADPNGTLPPV